MTTTATHSINILIERPDAIISAKVPGRMKVMVETAAKQLNMSISQYIKLSINERLIKDINKT